MAVKNKSKMIHLIEYYVIPPKGHWTALVTKEETEFVINWEDHPFGTGGPLPVFRLRKGTNWTVRKPKRLGTGGRWGIHVKKSETHISATIYARAETLDRLSFSETEFEDIEFDYRIVTGSDIDWKD